MKKTNAKKKLIPAAAMLAISAAMLSTATYAWFTMSKDVSVQGLRVQATAADGLVISGDAKSNWKTVWNVGMEGGVQLCPTSTDGAADPKWVTASSRDMDDADKNTPISGYTDISLTYTNTGVDGNVFAADEGLGRPQNDDKAYVLLKNFYIKSTGTEAWNKTLYIDEVKATAVGSNTGELNKALRVLVVVNDTDHFIYAPIENYDSNTKFKGTTNLSLVSAETDSNTTVTSIPNTDAEAINVKMYMYYEGEDQNCKSKNLAVNVDKLDISAKFGVKDNATPGGGN